MSLHASERNVYFLTKGKLFGVGIDEDCQLGQGKKSIGKCLPVEIKIPTSSRIILFQSGLMSNTTVVLTEGGLYGCGDNGYGQFGDGTDKNNRPRMQLIPYYKDKRVANFFSEGYALWVVLADDRVFRSGSNAEGELGNGSITNVLVPQELNKSFFTSSEERLVDVKGYSHTLLLTDLGNVYSCGNGGDGELGLGKGDEGIETRDSEESFYRGLVKEFRRVGLFFSGKRLPVHSVSVGVCHSLFIAKNEVAFSCGGKGYGQCGHNNVGRSKNVPTLIEGLRNTKIEKCSCGDNFSLFLSNAKVVWACGAGDGFQTGMKGKDGLKVPTVLISTEFECLDFGTCRSSTAFLSRQGEVFFFGANEYGQSGCGHYNTPIKKLTKLGFRIHLSEDSLFNVIPALSPLNDILVICDFV